ncbi:hypothetical protein J6Z48_00275 [bacterium]|nr:hypothetical protein [bacterium]
MFNVIFETITKYFPALLSIVVLFLVIFVGMYIFWIECRKSFKNDSSIFDVFLASSVLGGIIGRISYIVSNPQEFDVIWYWLPYEKYGDEVFLFRLLPWRYLRFWDFGNDTFAMFSSMAIIATLLVIFIKKWKWSHLYPAIYFCSIGMLATSIFLSGTNTKNVMWTEQGTLMLLFVFVSEIIRGIASKISTARNNSKIMVRADVVTIVLCTVYVAYSYLSTPMVTMEKVDLVVLIIWTVVGMLLYIVDSNKASVTIERVSSVQRISVKDVNPKITWKKE